MKRALILVGLGLMVPASAAAHQPWPTWYPMSWERNAIIWFADRDFDNGRVAAGARDAILAGHGRINQMPGATGYNYNGFRYDIVWGVPGEYNVNGIFWDPIPGDDGTYADITAWVSSNEFAGYFHSFDIRFNSAIKTWHYNVKTHPGLFEVDVMSVAVHEALHGMGHWTHWDEGGAPKLCNPPREDTYHSMCRAIFTGTVWMRSPEKHDNHTFNLVYP